MTQEEVNNIRAKREEQKRAKKAFTKLITFSVYLIALYCISFLERDVNSFLYKTNIDNYLYANENGKIGLSSVRLINIMINHSF